jgi:hypothetical protein
MRQIWVRQGDLEMPVGKEKAPFASLRLTSCPNEQLEQPQESGEMASRSFVLIDANSNKLNNIDSEN